MILLEGQEVNPEAVWHCLLLRVVLELARSVKEHLAISNFKDSVETMPEAKQTSEQTPNLPKAHRSKLNLIEDGM